jgi:CubicO group peptidase (beta-lactamase class C family)
MPRFTPLFALLPFLFATAACSNSAAPQPVDPFAQFDEFVKKAQKDYQVPGAVVVIVSADRVEFIKTYGVRSIARSDPIDTSTRFQIASNSKFMTAAAIGTLVDSQKTTWDQPVKDHYPSFQLASQEATSQVNFSDLLSHQSGLRSYDGDLMGRQGWSNEEILRRSRFMTLEPFRGEKAHYSNLAYFIAGEIAAYISDVRALDWETFVARSLLEPLGMTRSSGRNDALYLDDNRVAGHIIKNGNVELMDLEASCIPPAGSIVSTANDMARWMRMLLNRGQLDGKTVLQPSTVDALFVPVKTFPTYGLLNEPNGGYGLGTEPYMFLGTRVVSKNGALNGVRTNLALIPSKKIGIFIFANINLNVFPEAVTARFLEDQIGPSGKDLQSIIWNQMKPGWDAMATPPVPPTNPDPLPVDLALLPGTYSSTVYGAFAVTAGANNTLLMVAQDSPVAYAGTLKHWTGMQFLLDWGNPDDMYGQMTFQRSQDGTQVIGMVGSKPENSANIIDYGTFTR